MGEMESVTGVQLLTDEVEDIVESNNVVKLWKSQVIDIVPAKRQSPIAPGFGISIRSFTDDIRGTLIHVPCSFQWRLISKASHKSKPNFIAL
jgi:hypothetical protein